MTCGNKLNPCLLVRVFSIKRQIRREFCTAFKTVQVNEITDGSCADKSNWLNGKHISV